jgi:hypothetical protein
VHEPRRRAGSGRLPAPLHVSGPPAAAGCCRLSAGA